MMTNLLMSYPVTTIVVVVWFGGITCV